MGDPAMKRGSSQDMMCFHVLFNLVKRRGTLKRTGKVHVMYQESAEKVSVYYQESTGKVQGKYQESTGKEIGKCWERTYYVPGKYRECTGRVPGKDQKSTGKESMVQMIGLNMYIHRKLIFLQYLKVIMNVLSLM